LFKSINNSYYLILGHDLFLTFEESPPKAAMFLATHWRAKRWSIRPAFPWRFLSAGVVRNPRAPSLINEQKNEEIC